MGWPLFKTITQQFSQVDLDSPNQCTLGYMVATQNKNKNALETETVARAHEYWGG